MSTFVVSGLDYLCFKQTVTTAGSDITTDKNVKTFQVKAVGGEVLLKRASTDSSSTQIYLMEDRETLAFDIKMPYDRANNIAPLGTFIAVTGSVDLYFILGY